MQPTTSFHNAVVNAVAREQEEADATVAVTNKYEPVYIKEEALSALQTVLTKLSQNVASLKQNKIDSPQPHRAKNLLYSNPKKDQKCWWCGQYRHIPKNCGQSGFKNPSRSSLS